MAMSIVIAAILVFIRSRCAMKDLDKKWIQKKKHSYL